MSLYEITIPKDNSWDIMNELGNLNCIHFMDLNKHEQVFNLQYAPYIRRCEETERRIAFIEEECKKHNVKLKPPKSVDDFLTKINSLRRVKKKAQNLFFEEIETDITQKEKFVQEQIRKEKDIYDSYILLVEYKKVLKLSKQMIMTSNQPLPKQIARTSLNASFREEDKEESETKEALLDNAPIRVSSIIGTIQMNEKERFKKLVFRATRGNALCHFKDFEKPIIDYYGNEIHKTVYVVMFPDGEAIKEKISKLCDSFLGEKYDIPPGDIDDKISEVERKIRETKNIVQVTKEELKKYLVSINTLEDTDVSALKVYKWFIIKEKSLYVSLNKLRSGDKLLVGLFWLPNSNIKELTEKIIDIKEDRNISGPQIWKRENHNISPPTYFRLNEFTAAFQEITNTYGVPSYKEVNPSIFAIVTFPFLFGVMFGDIGHGFLLFLFGAFMCLAAERLKDSAIGALVQARYLILLMGLFATFNGICYNDFMSLPVELGTCFDIITTEHGREAKLTGDCVYAIGIDPTWHLSSNFLTFSNGFKMKMSVIFGVTQMSIGIFMKAFNSVYFGTLVDFFFEFIPQITLLMCLFGFMNVLIIVKWLTPWEGRTHRAPSIISIMISMFLSQGRVDVETDDALLWTANTQQWICIILLLIAFVCVPTMLLVKPLYMKCKMRGQLHTSDHGRRYSRIEEEKEDESKHSIDLLETKKSAISKDREELDIDEIIQLEGAGKGHHDFSEIFIHQLIETIEFVLGTVSNTASYLRLWALSLAHSQLADVFFEKLLGQLALSGRGSFYMVFLLFPVFFSFTLFVLMCMDSMECFLHTLRLHWVEFQNKFYKGNGYLFVPFSFEKELKDVK